MYQRNENPAGLPIYVQLSELLMREIAAGRYVDGERLPPERDLAKQLGTTVRTLRKALADLEEKGMLERVQGSGNYVRNNASVKSIYSMFRLERVDGGGLPTAQILSVDEMVKPADLPSFGTSRMATRIRRLRFLDKIPIAVEEIWLDGHSGKVAVEDLSDSLYRFYQVKLGFWISRAEDRVSIAAVPGWAPDQFGKKEGDLCGYIERLSWAQVKAPVEYSRTWFDADKAHYIQRMQ